MTLLIIMVLILLFAGGGNFYNDGAYRGYGFGLGGLLLIVLLVLFVTGNIRL